MTIATTEKAVNAVLAKVNAMAESVASLTAKFDALAAKITAERQEFLTAMQSMKALATQADLDALGALLDQQIAKVQGIITSADVKP